MPESDTVITFEEAKERLGIKPMTNEEWFASLSTEEKAKWMFRLTYKCYWCGREYEKTKKYNEKECPFHKCLEDSKGFKKWLKEKRE